MRFTAPSMAVQGEPGCHCVEVPKQVEYEPGEAG
ncbi:hypothetical protein KE639_00018 [Streptomyces sp. V17-9]|nr:hypothetical protein KE639_00018 [Streptomyces sp. V17-9]